jgi:hypothetical protein
MITRQCRFALVPAYPQFWRLSSRKFLVFQPTGGLFVVTCQKEVKEQLVFTGTKVVELPEGCVGGNEYFSLFASHLVAQDDVHFRVPPLNLSAAELTHHANRNMSALSHLLKDVSTVVHEPQVPIIPVTFPHHALSMTSIYLSVGAVFVLLLTLFALFFRYRSNVPHVPTIA